MATQENPNAGQGPVVLDIGGDRGALIVIMPAEMEDLEVEIIPTGTDSRPAGGTAGASHSHGHPHGHPHDHDHGHEPAPPHVAVVARPTPSGSIVHSLVFGSLPEGTYDLYVRPAGPIQLTATVVGGEVTQTNWM